MAMRAEQLREYFLLDPNVIYLNHGAFGACPQPVFEQYQHWQRELERQPTAFFQRAGGYDDLMVAARERLAAYVHAPTDTLIFTQNATAGINTAVRSLNLGPDDEILSTDLEYGALNNLWGFICQQTGARYVPQPMPLPFSDPDAVVDALWQGVTARTKIIYLSHITSATALILPLAQICARARAAGIMTIVDGAHAPGQIPVDLTALGVDIYSGNCHKWMCAPKGAAFLYVHPEHHTKMHPLVVGWGWDADTFARQNHWQGTRDPAAFLSVPAAIDFLQQHDWAAVQARCHALASSTRQRITEITGEPPLSDDSDVWFQQMMVVPLPAGVDARALQQRLLQHYRLELPATFHQDRAFLRVSFQGYNTQADADALVAALQAELG